MKALTLAVLVVLAGMLVNISVASAGIILPLEQHVDGNPSLVGTLYNLMLFNMHELDLPPLQVEIVESDTVPAPGSNGWKTWVTVRQGQDGFACMVLTTAPGYYSCQFSQRGLGDSPITRTLVQLLDRIQPDGSINGEFVKLKVSSGMIEVSDEKYAIACNYGGQASNPTYAECRLDMRGQNILPFEK